jgi:hypothetical protein
MNEDKHIERLWGTFLIISESQRGVAGAGMASAAKGDSPIFIDTKIGTVPYFPQ